MQPWICSVELPGKHRYENWNNNVLVADASVFPNQNRWSETQKYSANGIMVAEGTLLQFSCFPLHKVSTIEGKNFLLNEQILSFKSRPLSRRFTGIR